MNTGLKFERVSMRPTKLLQKNLRHVNFVLVFKDIFGGSVKITWQVQITCKVILFCQVLSVEVTGVSPLFELPLGMNSLGLILLQLLGMTC